MRGTLAPSTGPTEATRLANQAREILASFPEVKQVVSQVGRPDDGTDTTGFFNTEYFVDLKPKEQWRPVFNREKVELIAAMDRELEKLPGVLWNFSQPISDNMEEAVSGVKGELAIKIYGDDLKLLEQTGEKIVRVMSGIHGIQTPSAVCSIGSNVVPATTAATTRPVAVTVRASQITTPSARDRVAPPSRTTAMSRRRESTTVMRVFSAATAANAVYTNVPE